MWIKRQLAALRDTKKAVTALEYGLIAALIAVVIVGALSTMTTNLNKTFSTVSSTISTHNS